MTSLNIFISHKHEDNSAARAIKRELTKYSGNRVEVFLSSDIVFGEDWRKVIQSKLSDCNLLLLLFTDKKASWDWCLYEAGMFTRLDDESYKRVICLHSPDLEEPPGPLKHLQAVKATLQNIEDFLKKLYRTSVYTPDSPAINPGLDDATIRTAAQEILSFMARMPRDSHRLVKRITLHIQKPDQASGEGIDPDAAVLADEASLELFNKRPGNWRWKDLEEEAEKNSDCRWLKQLAVAIRQASKREGAAPIFATFTGRGFTARETCKLYQPILYGVEWERDGSMKFEILFNEEVTWRLPDIPEDLAVLQTAQTMALRFRYEVLRKYTARLEVRQGDLLQEVLSELSEVMQSIEQEAKSRGLLEEQKLLTVFDKGERGKIKAMYEEWYRIRATLNDAMKRMEVDLVKDCLSKLERYNAEFMPMAAQRYEALMARAIREEGVSYTRVSHNTRLVSANETRRIARRKKAPKAIASST